MVIDCNTWLTGAMDGGGLGPDAFIAKNESLVLTWGRKTGSGGEKEEPNVNDFFLNSSQSKMFLNLFHACHH